MSRTIRECPRRYIKVPDGKIWHRCKCEWCLCLDKKRIIKEIHEKEIKEGIDEHFGIYRELLEDTLLDYYEDKYPVEFRNEWLYWKEYR